MLFVCDLDNTLIHSYKKRNMGDICVEIRNGKELSYMTAENYKLLAKVVTMCKFIPLTTRSLEQFRRIDFGFVPKYAIVANGAILLKRGEIDDEWMQQSRALVSTPLPALTENEYIYDIRYVDDFFIFAKSTQVDKAVAYLKTMITDERLLITGVANKVYVFPKLLHKGTALNRMRLLLAKSDEKKPFCLAAGDSNIDIPMLNNADMALYPNNLSINRENGIMIPRRSFHLDMLKNAKLIIQEINTYHQ